MFATVVIVIEVVHAHPHPEVNFCLFQAIADSIVVESSSIVQAALLLWLLLGLRALGVGLMLLLPLLTTSCDTGCSVKPWLPLALETRTPSSHLLQVKARVQGLGLRV